MKRRTFGVPSRSRSVHDGLEIVLGGGILLNRLVLAVFLKLFDCHDSDASSLSAVNNVGGNSIIGNNGLENAIASLGGFQ